MVGKVCVDCFGVISWYTGQGKGCPLGRGGCLILQNHANHVHGIWLQCRWGHSLSHHRVSTGANDCYFNQQFCAMQWAFPPTMKGQLILGQLQEFSLQEEDEEEGGRGDYQLQKASYDP